MCGPPRGAGHDLCSCAADNLSTGRNAPAGRLPMTPELAKILQETSLKRVNDLTLWEVDQKVYVQVYEFLMSKYGAAMGRTNIMLNGHLITPTLDSATRIKANILSTATPEPKALVPPPTEENSPFKVIEHKP